MASKLFHAVVGVGISFGTFAACGGKTADPGGTVGSPDATLPEASVDPALDATVRKPKADAGAPDAPAPDDASAPPEASPDVHVDPVDAAEDVAHDVTHDAIVSAFCDVTWPITKSGREVCGPADDCWGLQIPWCYGPDGQGGCKLYPLECVGAEWHCVGGITPTNDPGNPIQCQ